MSSTNESRVESALPVIDAVEDSTEIELDRAYDDSEDPSMLTVFPADAEWPEIGTTWMSVDVDTAVAVEECR